MTNEPSRRCRAADVDFVLRERHRQGRLAAHVAGAWRARRRISKSRLRRPRCRRAAAVRRRGATRRLNADMPRRAVRRDALSSRRRRHGAAGRRRAAASFLRQRRCAQPRRRQLPPVAPRSEPVRLMRRDRAERRLPRRSAPRRLDFSQRLADGPVRASIRQSIFARRPDLNRPPGRR